MTEFNAATYLLTRHLEAGRGSRLAARGTTAVTYAELDELVADVAAAYRTLGLRRDDRVTIVSTDDVPMLAAILGAFRAGVVAVPVSTMQTSGELGAVLADSGARLVMCSHELAEVVQAALPSAPEVEQVVLASGEAGLSGLPGLTGLPELTVPPSVSLVSWEAFLDAGRAAAPTLREPVATEEDAWALWLYTSGTTGLPKAAMHRHANIRHVAETYGAQVLGIRPDDVAFSIAKMFFAYGIGNSVFFPMSVGAAALLDPRRPSPPMVQERLTADRPTLFFAVPTFYGAVLASELPDDAFGSVRLAASAGEPLPGPLLRRFKDRFGVDIIDGIGSTEALHIFLSNRPGDIRPGTTGTPVPGYDVVVRDENGHEAGPGEPGALHVRGESIALGYWRRTAATRQVFQGEWLVTGDTYVRDEAGYYTCLGRNSDMLKAGGIWVSPAEVESRLVEHPQVREAAVVGMADENGIEKPVAVVVADGVDEVELIAWCRDGMAHYKAPRRVLFAGELPKTATGKLQRFKVRETLAGPTGLGDRPTPEPAV